MATARAAYPFTAMELSKTLLEDVIAYIKEMKKLKSDDQKALLHLSSTLLKTTQVADYYSALNRLEDKLITSAKRAYFPFTYKREPQVRQLFAILKDWKINLDSCHKAVSKLIEDIGDDHSVLRPQLIKRQQALAGLMLAHSAPAIAAPAPATYSALTLDSPVHRTQELTQHLLNKPLSYDLFPAVMPAHPVFQSTRPIYAATPVGERHKAHTEARKAQWDDFERIRAEHLSLPSARPPARTCSNFFAHTVEACAHSIQRAYERASACLHA